jgi:hypothetical protein
MNLIKLSDEKLYDLCREYGRNAIRWRWRFAGLLPEVMRRRLYEKKGFRSIREFAAKLAGMSEEQVNLVLNLERRFEDKPALQSLLINGEVSVNKLARVASIATPENQEILADKVMLLPQKALEVLVKDEKNAAAEIEDPNGEQKPLFEDISLRAHSKVQDISAYVKIMECLSSEVKEKLLELIKKRIDINKIFLEFLENREAGIAEAKEEIAAEVLQKSDERKKQGKKPSRYIPAKVRDILKAEHGEKCSIPGCNKPAREKHHTQRFALAGTNDPRYMAPLCEEHHIIAQTIDIKYWQVRVRAVI